MSTPPTSLTTGLPGLDRVLHGIEPGDNIVWEVAAIADYQELVGPYALAAQAAGSQLIYFRFANHPSLLPESVEAEICEVYPSRGFESFVREVHLVIERAGRGAVYILRLAFRTSPKSGARTRASAIFSSSPARGCSTSRR